MQLSRELDDLLCRRYPRLYARRHGDPQSTAMGWGFEIGDGWFGIIDALSEVLSSRIEGHESPGPEVQQVKQKFGSLRFHIDEPNSVGAIVDLAEQMSCRVCEISGRPGRLCLIGQRQIATLAPGIELPSTAPRRGVTAIDVGTDPVTGGVGIPPLGFSLDDMARWRGDVLAGPVEIPIGWHDLADTLLLLVQRRGRWPGQQESRARVRRMWRDGTGLRLDWTDDDPVTQSLSAMAAALSRRIDPLSGAMFPVAPARE